MATVKKGLLTSSGLWARHLRRRLKKKFWRRERQAGRRYAKKATETPPRA